MARWLLLLAPISLLLAAGRDVHAQASDDAGAKVKVLGEFTNRYKLTNKYVLVAPGLGQDEFLAIAKTLHASEPQVTFWMLDDDSQAPQLIASLKEIEAGNSASYPADWANEHIVANLQEWLGPNGRHWVLCKGSGMDKIAELP
jgi:ferredoxin-NADP reductase